MADRIAATRKGIEDARENCGQSRGGPPARGMLPTLDELIASMEETETATVRRNLPMAKKYQL